MIQVMRLSSGDPEWLAFGSLWQISKATKCTPVEALLRHFPSEPSATSSKLTEERRTSQDSAVLLPFDQQHHTRDACGMQAIMRIFAFGALYQLFNPSRARQRIMGIPGWVVAVVLKGNCKKNF